MTIELYDETRRVKPGMFARIGIIHDRHEDALLVPRSAVVENTGETSVFVVEDGRAVQKPVSTGYASEGMVEIVSGLSDDEIIVTVGQVGLRPDAKVEIIDSADAGTRLAGDPDVKADTVSNDASTD